MGSYQELKICALYQGEVHNFQSDMNIKFCKMLPVADQKATWEGEHKEDNCEDQFEFLIFIFVGKPVL